MRPSVKGKFFLTGKEKLYIRGTTYGPFEPDEKGSEYHSPELVDRDFSQMASSNINTVRTYTVPPHWLLDIAQKHGLRVMIGLPWEQHVTFLDDEKLVPSIVERVREGVRTFAGHPGVFCYAIGNEIPAPIVRWHGREKIERFLKRLYQAAKSEDPDGLFTYVNYPTTEFLNLDFLDFACFNVYLEKKDRLEAYIARLHNVVGDTPLVLAEIGLDSMRNGEEAQAETLDWQVRTTFAQGCAGAFVFAWTDEWYRGGKEILDWDFGLTSRDRKPKLALSTVRDTFAEIPFPSNNSWPRISVVVASYNGASTIGQCLDGLTKLDYPNYEVIVIDDGSNDGTGDIARKYDAQVIRLEQQGLSVARNTGIEAATGEIVAFIDDDAYPDQSWLTYLAHTFATTSFAGVGGPNLTPDDDGFRAICIGEAPGNPNHVLLTDTIAEHVPGVNMSFRKACLQEIGGFDVRFRTAGDDVDICWRIQERGWQIGYNPAALVWHHRRPSMVGFLRQQSGYGKAEALLEEKWPEKYNCFGHVSWNGRVYGGGVAGFMPWSKSRIYQGTWGSALFQSIYQPAVNGMAAIFLMPECYAIVLVFGLLSILGLAWRPLLLSFTLFILSSVFLFYLAAFYASKKHFVRAGFSPREKAKRWLTITPLYLLQPLARLAGRIRHGLTFFRCNGKEVPGSSNFFFLAPKEKTTTIWSEDWQSSIDWLHQIEAKLRKQHLAVRRSGDFDHWDLEVHSGQLSHARVLTTIEEHGTIEKDGIGDQMIRLSIRPRFSITMVIIMLLIALLSIGAGKDGAWLVAAILASSAIWISVRMLVDNARTTSIIMHTVQAIAQQEVEKIKIKRAKREAAKVALNEDSARTQNSKTYENGTDKRENGERRGNIIYVDFDRRRNDKTSYNEIDRRTGIERRSGIDRRQNNNLHSSYERGAMALRE